MHDQKYARHTADIDTLMSRYRFERKFMELCRQCPNYGANWSCPPYDFDTGLFLSGFDRACIFSVTIEFDDAEYEKMLADKEYAKDYVRGLFQRTKAGMSELLGILEDRYPGSRGVAAGGCSHCASCGRARNQPCVAPREARYSLESLGLDVSMIAEDFLDIRLQWFADKPPRSQTLVHALLTNCDPGQVEDDIAAYYIK